MLPFKRCINHRPHFRFKFLCCHTFRAVALATITCCHSASRIANYIMTASGSFGSKHIYGRKAIYALEALLEQEWRGVVSSAKLEGF